MSGVANILATSSTNALDGSSVNAMPLTYREKLGSNFINGWISLLGSRLEDFKGYERW